MPSSETFSPEPLAAGTSRWGDIFISRFEWNVRSLGRVTHPLSGEEFKLDPKTQIQSFKRAFGEVVQLPLGAGFLKKERLVLAAVRLSEAALKASEDSQQPAEDILRQVSGPAGLDFQEETFYCVGVFSTAGWPREWKCHAEIRGGALFYLIEKGEGTSWRVFGPGGPLRNLFDPESQDEKMARAKETLRNHPKLVLPGDQISLDSFLEEHQLDPRAMEEAIQASMGQFHLLEHKGKSYIQRSIR